MLKRISLLIFFFVYITTLTANADNRVINGNNFQVDVEKWSDVVPLSKTGVPSYDPKVAVDSNGNAYVVWVENGKSVYFNTNSSGEWGNPQNVSLGEVQIKEGPWPEIEVDNKGVVNVVYTGIADGNYEVVINRFADGFWSGNNNVSRTRNGGSAYPTIVIDPNTNDYYLFWQDNANRVFKEQVFWEIVMRYLNGGKGSWSSGRILPDNQKRAYAPQATIDGNGAVYLVYANRAAGNITRVFFTQNKNPKDAEKWTNPIDISGMTGLSFAFPHIACNNQGNVYVVWMDNREGNIEVYFRKRVKGKWYAIENISNSPLPSRDPKIAVNKETGDIYIAWEENQKIYFREFKNGQWIDPIDLTQNSSPSAHPHLYVDQGGSIHLVFTDKRSGAWNIYYRTRMGTPLKKPSPPLNLHLSTTYDEATKSKTNHLNWEINPENEKIEIAYYLIYRKEEGKNSFKLINKVDGTKLSYRDKGLSVSIKYQYAIAAEDKWEQLSTLSEVASEARVFPPLHTLLETHINRFLFYREKVNKIYWNPNPLNEAVNISSYRIYRKKAASSDLNFTLIATISPEPDSTEFIDRGLSFDSKYAYAISTVDSNNNESALSSLVEED